MQNDPFPAALRTFRNTRPLARALALPLGLALFAACSSSDGTLEEPTPSSLGALVQDLVEDRDGFVVVATYTGEAPVVQAGQVEASGGQTVTSVDWVDDEIQLTFDQRVTPSHQVRIVGVDGIDEAWRTVSTSDPRRTRMGVLSATQDTSDALLGGDAIQVTFFGGPRVVEGEVEDISNWHLFVEGVELDLVGSTVSLDPLSQTALLQLGQLANLHATFEIAVDASTVADVALSTEATQGTATGDTQAPSLEGGQPIVVNLDPVAGNEFGLVATVDFDEPISPVFGVNATRFSVVDHPGATAPTVVTRAALDPNDQTRVVLQFSRPVVAGLDALTLDGIVDAHGNPVSAANVTVAASATAVNDYDTVDFVTVEGAGNDYVQVVLDQAVDPDSAEDPTAWTLAIDSVPVDLAQQTIDYDLFTKTVTFGLDFDVLNGAEAVVTAVAQVDVDGEAFAQAAPTATAAGDATAPLVQGITQNRDVDPDGTTVDVTFSEDVDVTTAVDTAKYTFTPALTVDTATVVDGTVVRLQVASAAIPGDVQLTVADGVLDPAGNTQGAAQGPLPLDSTDVTAPSPQWGGARVIEGADNDRLYVAFDDTLVAAEVTDLVNWAVQAPAGTPLDLTGSTVTYDATTGIATLRLDGGAAAPIRVGDEVVIGVQGARDIGGNALAAGTVTAVADGEHTRPTFETAFVLGGQTDHVVLMFSEPMDNTTDLYDAVTMPFGARYAVTDGGTGSPIDVTSAVEYAGGLGVELTCAATVPVGSTITVSGPVDLAGNPLFPVEDATIEAEAGTAPALTAVPELDAVTGARNDSIYVEFDEALASWQLLDLSYYTVTHNGSGLDVDLSNARLVRLSDTRFEIELRAAHALESGATYDVVVDDGGAGLLRTQQGVVLGGPLTQATVAVTGDVTQGPTAATVALLDPADATNVVVVFDETVDPTAAEVATEYSIAAAQAVSATLVGDRAVRLAFGSPVTLGQFVDITTSAAIDTAQNAASGVLSIAVTEDVTPPTIATVDPVISSGVGGDRIHVTFDEDVDATQAASPLAYTIVVDGGTWPVTIATVSYDAQTSTATLEVSDLLAGADVDVEIASITDLVGNAPSAPLTATGTAAGDAVAPSIVSAVVDFQRDPTGERIEVLFDEDVRPGWANDVANWVTSGTETVLAVEFVEADRLVLLLDRRLSASGTLTALAGVSDMAGNVAGALTVNPVE